MLYSSPLFDTTRLGSADHGYGASLPHPRQDIEEVSRLHHRANFAENAFNAIMHLQALKSREQTSNDAEISHVSAKVDELAIKSNAILDKVSRLLG